jgi:hypothetical protein
MKRTILALCLLLAIPVTVSAGGGHSHPVGANLSGFNEVHFVGGAAPALRGAIFSPARGFFRARIDEGGQIIHYTLSYEGLTGAVTQAHIHFGQNHTVGGIVVWLCQTTGTPAPDAVAAATPFCPESGPVSGTIQAEQVLAQALQGFPEKNFDALVDAIRNRAAYANVHSQTFGPGEIRGQIFGSPFFHFLLHQNDDDD